jgi:hypothetical protein
MNGVKPAGFFIPNFRHFRTHTKGMYTSAQKVRRPECDTVTSPDFTTQRPRNRMPRNEITGKRREITCASEGKRMRYCFDFLSFGVSIRFMVEHEAPHFLCASVHSYTWGAPGQPLDEAFESHPRIGRLFSTPQ